VLPGLLRTKTEPGHPAEWLQRPIDECLGTHRLLAPPEAECAMRGLLRLTMGVRVCAPFR